MKGSYEIRWKRSALKELKKLEKNARSRILASIEKLADAPRPRGSRKLTGSEGTYRIRVGSYRVIYGIFPDRILIEILRVRHRKDAYR